MSITREQAENLTRLYDKRHDLQRTRETASDKNFWLGVANDAFAGTGTRSSVLNKLGGSAEFASLMLRVVPARFEEMQQEIDAEIVANGGVHELSPVTAPHNHRMG